MRIPSEVMEQRLLACLYEEDRYDKIAAVLSEYFGNPVSLHDSLENILNHIVVPTETVSTYWKTRKQASHSAFVKDYTSKFKLHKDEPFILYNSTLGTYILAIKAYDHNGAYIGFLHTAVRKGYKITAEDTQVLKTAARVLSLAMRICESEHAIIASDLQWNTLVKNLFEGQFENREMMLRAMETQSTLCHYKAYRLILVTRAAKGFEPSQFNRYRRIFLELAPCLAVVLHKGEILVLFHNEGSAELFEKGNVLDHLAQENFLYMVCSDPLEDLWALPTTLATNQAVLRSLMRRHPIGRYARYDDCRLDSLIANTKTASGTLREYVVSSVLDIIEYDKVNETSYYETLKQYFYCHESIPRTAEVLFIHKTTVTYRLKKMEELFDLELNDYERKIQLYVSVYIVENFL